MPAPKHTKGAIAAHPAPSRDDCSTGEEYAIACKATHDARVAFDKSKGSAQAKLEAFGMDAICEKTAHCIPQRTIAKEIGVSWATFRDWINADKKRIEQYARAREAQADAMAEEILDIADDSENDTYLDKDGNERTNQEAIQRSRLRVDARKWLAGKMAPKKYGEKIDLEHTGANGGPIKSEVIVTMTAEEAYLAMIGKK